MAAGRQIVRSVLELRRNGLPTTVPPCTEPVSAMATSAYTDELLVVQGLRVIHAMDRGQSGHLPWTLERQEAVNWFLGAVNSQFASRFCTNQPLAAGAPSVPGGPCLDKTRRRAVGH